MPYEHTPTFLREQPKTEVISLIKHELCRLDVMLEAGRFKDAPELYQEAYCFWSKAMERIKCNG